MARRAARIAEQARGVDHGAVLLGVAGTVQLWGEVHVDEPDLVAYLIADACARLPDTRYELRRRPSPTAVEDGVKRATVCTCWYRCRSLDQVEIWGAAVPGTPVGGYPLPRTAIGTRSASWGANRP
jgi:hypothetical protein